MQVADCCSDNAVKTNNFAMKKLIFVAYLSCAFCEFVSFLCEKIYEVCSMIHVLRWYQISCS